MVKKIATFVLDFSLICFASIMASVVGSYVNSVTLWLLAFLGNGTRSKPVLNKK